MLAKVADWINNLVRTLINIFNIDAIRLDTFTSAFAPHDAHHLELLLAATAGKIQTIRDIKESLMPMMEWVDDSMVSSVENYCETYQAFLEHRQRFLKNSFANFGPWPVESRTGMDPASTPSSYKYTEKWKVRTRDVIEWTKLPNFLQFLWDAGNYHVVLMPPKNAKFTYEWENDAKYHEKNNRPFDPSERERWLRGHERFVLRAIELGDRWKHRLVTNQAVIQNYMKDEKRRWNDVRGREYLMAMSAWLREACFHEMYLSESEDVAVQIYAQDEKRHMQHVTAKRRL